MSDTKTVDVYGDELTVHWDGNVWVSPSNGQQHSRASAAMRVEIERYLSACGEDMQSEDTRKRVEALLSDMV